MSGEQGERRNIDASGKRFAIVVSRWNANITSELSRAAIEELKTSCASRIETYEVPGAWEIPLAVQRLLIANAPDAVIALGCILQGETAHAEQLANEVSSALMKIQLEHGVPVAWGILTPQYIEQALDRAGGKKGNKGQEAARAAIEMIDLLDNL